MTLEYLKLNAEDLTYTITSTRIVSYVNAGCIAILFFDFFECLEQEVETIWKKKWNITKFMYVLTRYSAFLEAAIVIYQISIPGEWYKECALSFKLNAWLFVFGLGVGEIIMTVRTWAVWKKSRFLMFALPIFYVVVWAAGFTSTALFLESLEFDPNPLTPYIGCYATYTSPIIFISWVLLLFYDGVMFALMAIPAFKAFRTGGTSRLMTIVYRDGVLYYLYLFALSVINIIVTLTFPTALILLFSLLSRVIHAILACRIVLNIHEYGHPVTNSQDHIRQESLPNRMRADSQHKRTLYIVPKPQSG